MIQTSGALGAAGLAGCLGGDGGDGGTDLPPVETYGPDGDRVSPTIYYDQGSDQAESIATEISNNLDAIGVNLQTEGRTDLLGEDFNSEPLPDANPDEFEYGPIGRNAGPPDKTRTVADWDLLTGIAANSYPRTPYNGRVFWLKDAPVNAYGYAPEVDMAEMYNEYNEANDPEQKQQLLNEIMGTLTEELPANFMSQGQYFWGFQNDINTSEEFNQYGFSHGTANRYRGDERAINGDMIWMAGTPFAQAYLPGQDDANSARRTSLVTDSSWWLDVNDEVVPGFIGIEDSGDSQVWVCTLRDNLQWGTDADGNDYGQMTAEDWVFESNMVHGVADDANDYWNGDTLPSAFVTDYEAIENVEQTGELEFQIELASPDVLFPQRPIMWGQTCYPKELHEKYAPDKEALRQSDEVQNFTWTGNLGPYTFESRTPGQTGSFTTSRNPDYYMRDHVEDSNVQTMPEGWAGAPYFENYQFNTIAEDAPRNQAFQNGEGDRMEINTDRVPEYRQDVDNVRIEESPDPYISFLFFNQRSNGDILCKERDGREAMALVINKTTISEQIQRGLTDPAVTFQPTWSEWYSEEAVNVYGIEVIEEDIEEARNLLRDNENFTVEEA
jgi:peptide/nickel transport system substrate-binding protein